MMSASSVPPSALLRWFRFNFVGLIGAGVQLGVLKLLLSLSTIDYRMATLIAVEVAVLHNFCWHVLYTWRERRLNTVRLVFSRLAQFHLANGIVSLGGSWTLMTLFVTGCGMSAIVANCVSIAACSILNFLLAEILVFRNSRVRGRLRRRGSANWRLFASP